jgi:hypothetical protein
LGFLAVRELAENSAAPWAGVARWAEQLRLLEAVADAAVAWG